MIAMVILNYNDYPTVLDCLNRIVRFECLYKIVVVDNCSTDSSWRKFKKIVYPKVDVVKSKNNKGYAAGNNVGIKHIFSCYPEVDKIIISNPDIKVNEHDIIKIADQVNGPQGVATGLIYNSDIEEEHIALASNWAWKVPNYKDMLCNCFYTTYKLARTVFKTSIYFDIKDYELNNTIEVGAVPGCFFVISKEALKKIGLFDERTFLFGEETILGFQLQKEGYKEVVVNNTKLLHKQSTSINKSIKADKIKNKYLLESQVLYLKKYLKCGCMRIKVFCFLYHLGIYEKKIIKKIKEIFNREKQE